MRYVDDTVICALLHIVLYLLGDIDVDATTHWNASNRLDVV